VRKRYWAIARELEGATLPDDLYEYVYEGHLKHVETGPPDIWVTSL
jgi:hypothetical protein